MTALIMTQTSIPVNNYKPNMPNTRSIRDIISRFEKLDNTPDKARKKTRFTHNIDLLSRNNFNENETSKANLTTSSRPITTILDETYNHVQTNARARPYSTVVTTNYDTYQANLIDNSKQQPSLVNNSNQNSSSIKIVINRDSQNDISYPSPHNYDRIEKNVGHLNKNHYETESYSRVNSNGYGSVRKPSQTTLPLSEISNDKIWNQIRRKSSVQLLKPSWVRRKSKLVDNNSYENHHQDNNNDDDNDYDDSTSDCLLLPHLNPNAQKILLPKRVSGPIYESRRSSFSTIKPSEIWEPEELPGRRMSKIVDENFINRKKSISRKENEMMDDNEDPAKSSWVKKPGDSVFLVRPSNVKTAEIQNNDKRFNANSIQSKLLNWCQVHTVDYENIHITNFSSSWANGLAFCALIHTFFPNAFDYSRLDANDRRRNFTLAFNTAEKYADVPQLLDVDDMIMMNNKPDSKCVFTYVSTFYSRINKLLKQNS